MSWGKYDLAIAFSLIVSHPFNMPSTARPDDQIEPINKGPFRGVPGSTVRLDCSITPGVLVDQYYVTWRSASNQSLVFYQSFPPRLNRNPINIDSQHYSLDPGNFSLYIHDVTAYDGAHDYACVLGVEDPMEITSTLLYTRTENVYLSLSILSKSKYFRGGTLLLSRFL